MSNVEADIDIHNSNCPSDLNCGSVYLTPKSGRYTDDGIKLAEDDEFICVLLLLLLGNGQYNQVN